jgi:hypothetical protein
MTALDTLTTAIALMSAAAGPEASGAAMRRDDADWWHLCREADRRAASRPIDAKTLRARRLLAGDISYDRAYGEIMRDRPAPEAMVEALMFSLRRGVNELIKPDTLRRLSAVAEDQLEAVCLRVQAFQPKIAESWCAEDLDLLISAWRKCRDQR